MANSRCSYVKECISKPTEKPNCIKDYPQCIVYQFYENNKNKCEYKLMCKPEEDCYRDLNQCQLRKFRIRYDNFGVLEELGIGAR